MRRQSTDQYALNAEESLCLSLVCALSTGVASIKNLLRCTSQEAAVGMEQVALNYYRSLSPQKRKEIAVKNLQLFRKLHSIDANLVFMDAKTATLKIAEFDPELAKQIESLYAPNLDNN